MTPGSQWLNNKHGTTYVVEGLAINATNGQNGDRMVIYHKLGESITFVREIKEFATKFTEVPNGL